MNRSKKSLAFLLVTLMMVLLACETALACPVYPGAITVKDANGETFQILAYGDEFFSFSTDLEGNLLAKDGSGVWYFVNEQGGKLVLGTPVADKAVVEANKQAGNDKRANVDNLDLESQQENIAALYAQVAKIGENKMGMSTVPPDPETYDPNTEANDALYGKYVYLDDSFDMDSPDMGATCPLIVVKVNYSDLQCEFTDAEWAQRIYKDGVSKYYLENSNGKFTYVPATETSGVDDGIVTVNIPINALPYTAADGGIQTGLYTGTDGKNYAIFNDSSMFAYALAAADEFVDFSQFDRNGDGAVTPHELAMLVVVAGLEAATIGEPDCYGIPCVWAHSWMSNDGYYYRPVENDGVILYKYTMMGENANGDAAYDPTLPPLLPEIGTACHELGHDQGLKDLYDPLYQGLKYEVRALSLMASGSWGAAHGEQAGSSPVHIDPYQKMFLNWYSARTVDSGVYEITEASNSSEYNILRINTADPDIYYLIENRQLSGYDRGMERYYELAQRYYINGEPNMSGVVIWRIDEYVVDQLWDINRINCVEGYYGIMPLCCEPGDGTRTQFWNERTYAIMGDIDLEGNTVTCLNRNASIMSIGLNRGTVDPAVATTRTYADYEAMQAAKDLMAPSSGLTPDSPKPAEDLFGVNEPAPEAEAPADTTVAAGALPPQTADAISPLGFVFILLAVAGLVAYKMTRKA